MSQPLITALYASLGGLLVLLLTWRVIALRRSAKIGIGDGGNAELARRIRVHANAIETLPLQLILLLCLELSGFSAVWIHGFGSAIVLGRVLHAIGLSGSVGVSPGRFIGTLLSLAVTALMPAVVLLRLGGWL